MTLPVTKAKRGHHAKSSNDKGLLGFIEVEKASAVDTDATERVLAAVKGLKEDYERHYAEIESRVKKSIEGPVKTFTMDDGKPIVMQLSVWDTKLGPVTAMLVGDADLMVSIPADELDASTRMMDILVPGNTCDLSKDDLGRLMVKFSIVDPAVRGGEAWLLVTAYHDLAMDIPRATIRELLAQTTMCWHDDASLATEAMTIRDRFDVARSRWLMYLTELRRSIWSIVQKSRDTMPQRPIPDIDIPAVAEVLPVSEIARDTTIDMDNPEPEQDAEPEDEGDDFEPRPLVSLKKDAEARTKIDELPDEKPEKAIDLDLGEPAWEPVPVRLLPARPAPLHDDCDVIPIGPAKVVAKTKAIEPAIIDVLGKLQRNGCSVKVDKDTQNVTAFRLVELEPGTGGLIALAYSFRAVFLPFPVIHVIDGACYAGDDRANIDIYRPGTSDVFHDHLPASEECSYRGNLYGRVHHDRALKPVTVPVVFVQHAITGADGDMHFCWIEPVTSGTRGYFLVVASEIDAFDGFVMNALRVLGPRMATAESEHVTTVGNDIKRTNITGRGLAIVVFAMAAAGILASLQWLPLPTTVAFLQYWYVLAAGIIGALLAMGHVYHGLDTRVSRAVGARAAAVTARTPFLVVPGWEDIVPAARRIGKVLFPRFKTAFCQDLDAAAIDEATEVVFRQETFATKPARSKAFDDMEALATKAKMARHEDARDLKATSMLPGLKVTDARAARYRSRDGDILNDELETDDASLVDPGKSTRIDPLEALRDR